ncbi:hypothetical protein HAX54_033912, partial [Datura stramonium]|nr:hypothetical protein [Datura stramonium]
QISFSRSMLYYGFAWDPKYRGSASVRRTKIVDFMETAVKEQGNQVLAGNERQFEGCVCSVSSLTQSTQRRSVVFFFK